MREPADLTAEQVGLDFRTFGVTGNAEIRYLKWKEV